MPQSLHVRALPRPSPSSRLLTALVMLLIVALVQTGANASPPTPDPLADVTGVIVALDGTWPTALAVLTDLTDGLPVPLGDDMVTIEVDDPAAALQALANRPGVRYAEPDWPLTLSAATAPDDLHFDDLWGLHNTGQSSGTAGADISALDAWEALGPDSGEVVVAVVDSGVDHTHPDLTTRMWRNDGLLDCPVGATGYDFVTQACVDGDADPNGHGTHVAGTIAAAIGNGEGIAGVAPNARILDLRFIAADGVGSTSDAVAAVNLATSLAADGVPLRVLNASWGGPGYSAALSDAITAAGLAGITVVAAAGNLGEDVDVKPMYPCAYPHANVVCVAASTRHDDLATFSNHGATTVDLAAPGADILSTYRGGYAWLDGTSMAAPHVAGVTAMLAGACPLASVATLRGALLAGVSPLDALVGKTVTSGRLEASAALSALACTWTPPGAPGPLLIGPSNPVVSWTPGDGTTFTLQRAAVGSADWYDLAPALAVAQYDLSNQPEGRMDLRVIATLGGETATSPVATDLVIDRTPPTIVLTGCPTGQVAHGSMVTVQVSAADPGSGLAVDPSGNHVLATSSSGTQTATFTATDRVLLSSSTACTYQVTEPLSSGGTSGGGGGGAPPPPADEPAEEPVTDDPVVDEPAPDAEDGDDPIVTDSPITAPSRIDQDDPTAAALQMSQLRFNDAGMAFAGVVIRPARHVVLARNDAFADALAGAALSGDGPLLLTTATALDRDVAAELQRVLPAGGTVYLLGGEGALSATVEQAVRGLGLQPTRLAGPSRIETALRVADEVAGLGMGTGDVLVARAYGPSDNPTAAWADAISGGAYGASTTTPLILTAGEALHPAVADWIARTGRQPILLGGTAALSGAIADVLPTATRVEGTDRAATAAAVATDLWQQPTPLAAAMLINGWHERGWAYGLAAAGLAADLDAPLLVIDDTVPPATRAVLGCTATTVLGAAEVVAAEMEALLAESCLE